MSDKDKKVVNTEEQNRTVNPEDKSYEKDADLVSDERPLSSAQEDATSPEIENPDQGDEIETPHRIEGDDAGDIERKIPNL
jgi:hypothetical protein